MRSLTTIQIPKNHPRYHSLVLRERIIEGMHKGIVAEAGLIAYGRGEAFDYLLGEKTISYAKKAIKAAAAKLLLARYPVISVNGNTAVLAHKWIKELADIINAKIEVNLFYNRNIREDIVSDFLKNKGLRILKGLENSIAIPCCSSRMFVNKEGIAKADVVLLGIEDGDRTKALKKIGKFVIAIDLNPLSRTARDADITIVDNIVRCVPLLCKYAKEFKDLPREDLEKFSNFNNKENLEEVLKYMARRLEQIEI